MGKSRNRILAVGIILLVIFLFIWGKRQTDAANAKDAILHGQIATAQVFNTKTTASLIASQEYEKVTKSKELAALAQSFAAETKDRSWIGVHKSKERMDLSLLLSVEAFKMDDNFQTRDALLKGLFTFPYARKYLAGHTAAVSNIVFSSDGKLLASCSLTLLNSGGEDGQIIFWDATTGLQIGDVITASGVGISELSFSPDGNVLASAGWNQKGNSNNIIFWDVKTHKEVGQITDPHWGKVIYSPNGKYLAVWGANIVALYDPITYKPLGQIFNTTANIWNAAFSPDGTMLAVGSGDSDERGIQYSTLTLWDSKTGEVVWHNLMDLGNFGSIAFSPDGKVLATTGNMSIAFWDAKAGIRIDQPISVGTYVYDLAFTPDGKTLASSNSDGTVSLWDISVTSSRIFDGGKSFSQLAVYSQMKRLPLIGHTDRVNSITISPDGKMLASASEDKSVILWDLTPEQPIEKYLIGRAHYTKYADQVAFSPDNKILASRNYKENTIFLWDMKTGSQIGKPMTNIKDGVRDIIFSPDSDVLAISMGDGSVSLWEIKQKEALQLPVNNGTVAHLAFSPDSKVLAGGGDGTITLWNTTTHQRIGKDFSSGKSAVWSMVFSPDGKFLVVGGTNGISLIDTKTYKILKILNTHSSLIDIDNVYSLAFSSDGKLLAAGYQNDTVALWDTKTYTPVGKTLVGPTGVDHYAPVFNIAFSNDNKILSTNNIFWDIATSRQIYEPLTSQEAGIFTLSLDQSYLAISKFDGTIELLNMNPEFWTQKTCEIVQRNLTRSEWAQYEFTEPYHATCPQWPLEVQ